MMRNAGSTNMASAYAVGLMACWNTMWTLALHVWMRPSSMLNGSRGGQGDNQPSSLGLPRATARIWPSQRVRPAADPPRKAQGSSPLALALLLVVLLLLLLLPSPVAAPPDVHVAKSLDDGFEYYWQSFPTDAPFSDRLDWVLDLHHSWRGSGWNWAIPSIPAYQRPDRPQSGELVKLDTIPLATRCGFRRSTTVLAFLRDRCTAMVLGYLVLDACGIIGMNDPYFVFGPDHPQVPLPPYLAALHPAALSLYRSVYALTAMLATLHTTLSFEQVAGCLALTCLGSTRGQLWHYPALFGRLDQVLDHGLTGFWGGFWHQSFRLGFVAPALWLVRNRYLQPGRRSTRALAGLVAFAQSGLLHASASFTTLPLTQWWMPFLFFFLSWVGTVVQAEFCAAFRPGIHRLPRAYRRAGNLLFVALWLHCTQWAFIDDLGRCALWLFEPIPISPLRWMGFGRPGDSWWRWDQDHLPGIYIGKHWWQSGLRI